jgi:hypothetical protein
MAQSLCGTSTGSSRSHGRPSRFSIGRRVYGNDGHLVSARTKRAHEPHPEQGHQSREVRQAPALGARLSVSSSSEGTTRYTGHRVSRTEEGCLRTRVFLASSSAVWENAKDATRFLDSQAAGEQGTRPEEPASAEGARMGLSSGLGMRPQGFEGGDSAARGFSPQQKASGVVR